MAEAGMESVSLVQMPNGILHAPEPVSQSAIPNLLFNTHVRLGYNPSHFQMSIRVVLRKLGKKDYRIPKVYKLIVLFTPMVKLWSQPSGTESTTW